MCVKSAGIGWLIDRLIAESVHVCSGGCWRVAASEWRRSRCFVVCAARPPSRRCRHCSVSGRSWRGSCSPRHGLSSPAASRPRPRPRPRWTSLHHGVVMTSTRSSTSSVVFCTLSAERQRSYLPRCTSPSSQPIPTAQLRGCCYYCSIVLTIV